MERGNLSGNTGKGSLIILFESHTQLRFKCRGRLCFLSAVGPSIILKFDSYKRSHFSTIIKTSTMRYYHCCYLHDMFICLQISILGSCS